MPKVPTKDLSLQVQVNGRCERGIQWGKVHIVDWSKDIIAPVPANIHIGKGIVKPSLDNLEEQTRFQKKS